MLLMKVMMMFDFPLFCCSEVVEIKDDYMTQVQCLSIQREVQLRFLCPADIPEVKKLCKEWFPIE